MADVRLIGRVACLAQMMFIMIAERFVPNHITAMQSFEDKIYFHEPSPDEPINTAIVPLGCSLSYHEKHILLSIDGCSHALQWVHHQIDVLLIRKGYGNELQEVALNPHKQPRPAFKHWSPGPSSYDVFSVNPDPDLSPMRHQVYVLNMKKSKSRWIIDVTAAQYGFYDLAAVPLALFVHRTGLRWSEVEYADPGTAKKKWKRQLNDPVFLPQVHNLSFACADEVDKLLDRFQFKGQPLADFLDKNEAVFREVSEAFLKEVSGCITKHVARLHSTNGPLRRNAKGQSVLKRKVGDEECADASRSDDGREKLAGKRTSNNDVGVKAKAKDVNNKAHSERTADTFHQAAEEAGATAFDMRDLDGVARVAMRDMGMARRRS